MKIGYRRVSSLDQNLDRQDLGPLDKTFEEKLSGVNAKDRPELQNMMEFAREGDEVIVWSIDRMARDLRDLQTIIQTLLDKNVSITFISENLTFSASSNDPFAKLQLHLMGAFAEFERSIIRKRQAEGIAKAKHVASTGVVRQPLIQTKSSNSNNKAWVQPRSPLKWALVGSVFIVL